MGNYAVRHVSEAHLELPAGEAASAHGSRCHGDEHIGVGHGDRDQADGVGLARRALAETPRAACIPAPGFIRGLGGIGDGAERGGAIEQTDLSACRGDAEAGVRVASIGGRLG